MAHFDIDEDDAYIVIEKHSGGLGSFFVGLAIGAGVALLLAPRSGADTRREIQRRARGARDAATRVATDVTDTVVGTFEDARRRVEEQIDDARTAIDLKKAQVHRAMEAGRIAAADARVELEQRIAETKAAYAAGSDVVRAGRPATSARTRGTRSGASTDA